MSEIKNYYYCYCYYYYYYDYIVQITLCFTQLHSVYATGLHTRHITALEVCKRSTETSTHAPLVCA